MALVGKQTMAWRGIREAWAFCKAKECRCREWREELQGCALRLHTRGCVQRYVDVGHASDPANMTVILLHTRAPRRQRRRRSWSLRPPTLSTPPRARSAGSARVWPKCWACTRSQQRLRQ
eukprot:scaffold131384_cov20-Tisochrysis_lutea.AAC.2